MLIDGRGRGVFDLSGAVRRFGVSYRFGGLDPGSHTIRVVVLGHPGRFGPSGTAVAVDGFAVGGSTLPASSISYRWAVRRDPAASGGASAIEDDAGASLWFRFRGTSISWITVKGPDQGRAAVYVDGALRATYDGYATDPTYGVPRAIRGLSDAEHALHIVVLGTARPGATGTGVSVDAFRIT